MAVENQVTCAPSTPWTLESKSGFHFRPRLHVRQPTVARSRIKMPPRLVKPYTPVSKFHESESPQLGGGPASKYNSSCKAARIDLQGTSRLQKHAYGMMDRVAGMKPRDSSLMRQGMF